MRTLYFRPVVSSSSFFYPHVISAVADWMSTTLYPWCGLSANLECRSEMYCTRPAGNTRRKNDTKNRHLGIITQLYRAISLPQRHVLTIRKNLLNSNASSTCPHNILSFGPLTAEIGSGVSGTSANFNGFRVLASLLQRRHSVEANQTLHDV